MSDIKITGKDGQSIAISADTGYEEEMIRLRRRLAEATVLLGDIEADSDLNPLGFLMISREKLNRVRQFLVTEAKPNVREHGSNTKE